MNYTIQKGDCLSSLASACRLKSYRAIYDHPNNAAFKMKRPNPNIVYPGDVVFIPEIEIKQESRSTDKLHSFQVSTPKVLLRVKLLDHDRKPYSYKRYRLDVEHQSYFGWTKANGLVQELIPAVATDGVLNLWLSDSNAENATTRMELRIGHLDPVEEVTGIQARLDHLGFPCGTVDGIAGPKTAAALKAFQASVGLPATGEINRATRDKLEEMHDDE